jgi:hypothetical protein
MIIKRIWIGALMLITLLLLSACGSAQKDLLVGRWQLSNIETILTEQDIDFTGYEDYVELGLAIEFSSDETFILEVSVMLDFETMIFDLLGDEAEVEAEPANLTVSISGTYEKTSDGVLILNYDTDTLGTTPEEYCYSVSGFETCTEVGDLTAGFEDLLLYGDDGASYEVDETSLTLWDDACGYPENQSCAAHFTK